MMNADQPASDARMLPEQWWPLAVASAETGRAVTSPDVLLSASGDDRAMGASLLALVDADDPGWDAFVRVRAGKVRVVLAGLAVPARVFDRLVTDKRPAVQAALAANTRLPVEWLDRVNFDVAPTDVIPALLGNPSFVAGHQPRSALFDSVTTGVHAAAMLGQAYEPVVGPVVRDMPVAQLCLPRWLANPATRPADIEFLYRNCDSGLFDPWMLAGSSAPASILAELAEELLTDSGPGLVSELVCRHPSTPPDAIERLIAAGRHLRHVVCSPNLSPAAVDRLMGPLSRTEPVPPVLLNLFANPCVPGEVALSFLCDDTPWGLADRIVSNPNVTVEDLARVPARFSKLAEREIVARRFWPAVNASFTRLGDSLFDAPAGAPAVPAAALPVLLQLAASQVSPAVAVEAALRI